MLIRRCLSWFALLSLWAICLSCGQNYRLPIIQVPGDPGDPKLYHFAMTINATDPATNANIPGTVLQIDTAGDQDVGEAKVGRGPIYATLLPTGAANRIYIANSLEDTVTTTTAAPLACSPGPVCPIGTVSTITMPTGSGPSFLNSTEASNMYVILPNRGVSSPPPPPSLGVIAIFQNSLAQQIPLPAGNPVAMVELPNGHKLYVLDEANNAVYVVQTSSRQIVQTLSVGVSPTMALASPDNSAVYVMTNNGIFVIDALTDQVISGGLTTTGQPNSMAYDVKLNRLYVTDTSGRVGVFNTAVPPGTLPTSLLITPAGFVPGALGVAPLPDGTRFYVLGNPDPSGGPTSLTLTAVDSLTLQSLPIGGLPSYALDCLNSRPADTAPQCLNVAPEVPACKSVRFRFMVGASADSGRIYVSSCDAGGTYVFRTSDNTGVRKVASPAQPSGANSVPQNPVFLITGR